MNPLLHSLVNPLSQSSSNLDFLPINVSDPQQNAPSMSLASTQYSLYTPVNARVKPVKPPPTLRELAELYDKKPPDENYLNKVSTMLQKNSSSQQQSIKSKSDTHPASSQSTHAQTLPPQHPLPPHPTQSSNMKLPINQDGTALRASYQTAVTNNSSTDSPENCFKKPMSVVRVFTSLKGYGRKLFRKKRPYPSRAPSANSSKFNLDVPLSPDFRNSEEFLYTGKSRIVTRLDESGENVMILPDGHRMMLPKPSLNPPPGQKAELHDIPSNRTDLEISKSQLRLPEMNDFGVKPEENDDDDYVTEDEDIENSNPNESAKDFEGVPKDFVSTFGRARDSRQWKRSSKVIPFDPTSLAEFLASRKDTFTSYTESMIPQVGSELHDADFPQSEYNDAAPSSSSVKKRAVQAPLNRSNSVKSFATNVTSQSVLAHPAGIFRAGRRGRHKRNRSTHSHRKTGSNASSAVLYPNANTAPDQEPSLPRTNASSVIIHSVDVTPTSSNRNTMTNPSSSPTSIDFTQEAIHDLHRWLETQIRAAMTGKTPRPRSHSGVSMYSGTSGKRQSTQSLRRKRSNIRYSFDTVESVRWLNAVNDVNLTEEERQQRLQNIQESITKAASKAVASAAAQFMSQYANSSNSLENQTTADFLEWYVAELQKYCIKMRKKQHRYSKSSVSPRPGKSRNRSSTSSSRWRKIKVPTPTFPVPVDQRPLRDSLALTHAWHSQKDLTSVSPGISNIASRGDNSERILDDNVSEALESVSEAEQKQFVMVHETMKSLKSMRSGVSLDFSINADAAVFGLDRRMTQGSTTTTSTTINPDLWMPPEGRVIKHKRGKVDAVFSFQEDDRRRINGHRVEETGENASFWAPSDTEYDFMVREDLAQIPASTSNAQSLYQHPEATINSNMMHASGSQKMEKLPIMTSFDVQSAPPVQRFNLPTTQPPPPPVRSSSPKHRSRPSDMSIFNNSEKNGTLTSLKSVKSHHTKQSSGAITPTWFWTDETYKQTAAQSTTEDLVRYLDVNRMNSNSIITRHRFDEDSRSESEASTNGIPELQIFEEHSEYKSVNESDYDDHEKVEEEVIIEEKVPETFAAILNKDIGSSGSVLNDLGLFKDEVEEEEDGKDTSLMREIEAKLNENMGSDNFFTLSKLKGKKNVVSANESSSNIPKASSSSSPIADIPERARTPTPTTGQDTTLYSSNVGVNTSVTSPETVPTSPNSSLIDRGSFVDDQSDDETPTPSLNVDFYETPEWAAAEASRGKPSDMVEALKKVQEAAAVLRSHSLRLSKSPPPTQRNSILFPPKIPLPPLEIKTPNSVVSSAGRGSSSSGSGSASNISVSNATMNKTTSTPLTPRPYVPSRTALSNPSFSSSVENLPTRAYTNTNNPLLTSTTPTPQQQQQKQQVGSSSNPQLVRAIASSSQTSLHNIEQPNYFGTNFGNGSSSIMQLNNRSSPSLMGGVKPMTNNVNTSSTNLVATSSSSVVEPVGSSFNSVRKSNSEYTALQSFGPGFEFTIKTAATTRGGKIPNFDEKLEMRPGDKVILIELLQQGWGYGFNESRGTLGGFPMEYVVVAE
ncbi:hypothetical protein HK098_006067 [Nowakowskiella sp. JEL0407]|nr:hypothetical protein HK098_006067 [Nowakowskiella sp. JEL0407]